MNKYFILILLVALTIQSQAQEIIRIMEKDQESDTFFNKHNADINSRLTFTLNKSNLLKRITSFTDTANLPSEVDNLLLILTGALEKKQEWMKAFAEAVITYEKGNKENINAFINRQATIAGEILVLLRGDDKLYQYFEEDESLDIWTQLTNAINRRIAEIERELLTSPRYADIRVQMGGWLIHNNNEPAPLHFEGLDTNPVGEFYEVERWRFTPTENQLKEFEQMQKLAKEDELNEANFSEIIRSKYITGFTDQLKKHLTAYLEDLKKKADEIISSIGVGAVKTDLQDIISSGKSLIDFAKEKIEFYSGLKNNPSFSLNLLATSLAKDVTEFNTTRKKLKELLEKLKADIESASAAIQTTIAGMNFIPLVEAGIKGLSEAFLGQDGLNVLNAGPIADIALDFGDKVLSLSLKDIPEEPVTDLRYAGFRESGDKVVVKLIVTKGDVGNRVLQETKDITLYRILPHIEMTVGVIFAHPLSETSIEKDFQMAPYYNLLFKGIFGASKKWKRNSSLPNTLLDMNFGLHLSSPDFNKDDVPELGVGLVVSTLKDYLQFGWAYNIFHGTPYLFFGIRLPTPTLNFGGNGNSSASINK